MSKAQVTNAKGRGKSPVKNTDSHKGKKSVLNKPERLNKPDKPVKPKEPNKPDKLNKQDKPIKPKRPKAEPFIRTVATDYEAISWELCIACARKDAQIASKFGAKYIDDNSETYYVVCNTWLLMIGEYSFEARLELRDALVNHGLFTVIRECTNYADEIISHLYDADDLFSIGARSHAGSHFAQTIAACCPDVRTALQLLRYAKRFSPLSADLLDKTALDKFYQSNRICKSNNNSNYYDVHDRLHYIVLRLREIVSAIVSDFDEQYNVLEGHFSSGVAADATRSLASKVDAYAYYQPFLYSLNYPLTIPGKSTGVIPTTPTGQEVWIVKPTPVPKTYKTSRIIAPEHSYRLFHAQAVRHALERCVASSRYRDCLHFDDQSYNQVQALEGSASANYSTIDLSSASDLNSRSLCYAIFPENVAYLIWKFAPSYIQGRGKDVIKLEMVATSGSPLTFPVEAITFLSVCILAGDLVKSFTGYECLPPQVFGDDLIVDTHIAGTVMDLLEELGFIVNEEKSFTGGPGFRESCGVDAFLGIDVTSVYFPRKTLKWDAANIAVSTQSLCSLEHRLFHYGAARRFLIALVRTIEPRMTSHRFGCDCADLWEHDPVFKRGFAPHKGELPQSLEAAQGYERELHLALSQEYPNEGLDTKLPHSGMEASALVQMYRYVRFLLHGPTFDDELLRLLGVSSAPNSYASDICQGRTVWRYVAE